MRASGRAIAAWLALATEGRAIAQPLAAPAPESAASLAAPRVEVNIVGREEMPFRLAWRNETAQRASLCVTPCTLHLEPGSYLLRAESPGRQNVSTRLLVTGLRPTTTLEVSSPSSARVVGGTVLIVTSIVSAYVALIIGSLYTVAGTSCQTGGYQDTPNPCEDLPNEAKFVILGGFLAAIVGGVIMLTAPDGEFRLRH